MSARSQSRLLAVSTILFSFLLVGSECPELMSEPFEGIWRLENPETGITETWSIVQERFKLMITVKRENGNCEILIFDAEQDSDVDFGFATGNFGTRGRTIRLDSGQLIGPDGNAYTLIDDNPQTLSCADPMQSSGEFSGLWSFANNDDRFQGFWSIVQTGDQLMITRRQEFDDGFCGIEMFEATVEPDDPKMATGRAFNLDFTLAINPMGNMSADFGSGPDLYVRENESPQELTCPE